MLEPFADEIWLAGGGTVSAIGGFRYPTRMAVMRLADGGLVIWSPVALTDDLCDAVAALGPVAHIVAPNSLHHLFVAEWAAAWPDARLCAAPGLDKIRPDIAFDTVLGDTPDPAWAGQIDQVVMAGNAITTEIVFFHAASGTVLFTDLLQHLPGWFSGWRAWVAKWDLMAGPEPAVPRKFRLAFTDRTAARAALDRILAWPARQVVMAHGAPVTSDAPAFLRRAFAWLKPQNPHPSP